MPNDFADETASEKSQQYPCAPCRRSSRVTTWSIGKRDGCHSKMPRIVAKPPFASDSMAAVNVVLRPTHSNAWREAAFVRYRFLWCDRRSEAHTNGHVPAHGQRVYGDHRVCPGMRG